MTWTCPACRTTIQHTEETPRPDIVYRCHICRLELVADAERDRLTLAPLPGETHTPAPNKTVAPLRAEAHDMTRRKKKSAKLR
jgi:hypothetical protein